MYTEKITSYDVGKQLTVLCRTNFLSGYDSLDCTIIDRIIHITNFVNFVLPI